MIAERNARGAADVARRDFGPFFHRALRHERLSPAEEADLGRRVRRADGYPLALADAPEVLAAAAAARDRLVACNLALGVKVALEYAGRGLAPEDLAQEGALGVREAARRFDPAFGVKFSTHAVWWVRSEVRRAIVNHSLLIRLPAHLYPLLRRWRRSVGLLRRELGREPTPAEAAAAAGVTPKQAGLLARAERAARVGSLAAPPPCDGPERFGAAALDVPDPNGPDPDRDPAGAAAEVAARLAVLTPREREVVELRFGLSGGKPMIRRRIAAKLGVTRECVRKIELQALDRMAGRVPPSGWIVARSPDLLARLAPEEREVLRLRYGKGTGAARDRPANPSYVAQQARIDPGLVIPIEKAALARVAAAQRSA